MSTLFNDANFVELVLKMLVQSPRVFQRAKSLGMTGDDFIISNDYGFRVYKILADTLFKINICPLPQPILVGELRALCNDGLVPDVQKEYLVNLTLGCYQLVDTDPKVVEQVEDYVLVNIREFVEYRRFQKIKVEAEDNPSSMRDRLNELSVVLKMVDSSVPDKETFIKPFENMIVKSSYKTVLTGLNKIDQVCGGLHYGSYNLLLGYSGGGKTALGTLLCGNAAIKGTNAIYVSMEELDEDIAQRFYSRFFHIEYGSLRSGSAGLDLEQAWKTASGQTHFELMKKHLGMLGLKEQSPVTIDVLYRELQRVAREKQFIPELVVVDQMEFIDPLMGGDRVANLQSWEINREVSNQCDELSHMKIEGKFFALLVQHQIKGNMKWRFQPNDIDGYKGIIKPVDLALGVGRENKSSPKMNIFSLKSRHCKDFEIEYMSDLAYMDIFDLDNGSLAKGEYAESSMQKGITDGSSKNERRDAETPAADSNPFNK